MRCTTILVAGLLVLVAGGRAHVASVYRCIGTDGSVSFQDQTCRSGQAPHVVHLPDAATGSPATASVATPADDAASPSDAVAVPTAVSPRTPPPDFFLCTRHDGSLYASDDGRGGRSAVPLGMLGVPERSLAQAYGGRNGIGVAAPGLRPIPEIPAAQVPLAGGYVWIDDACHHATAQEAYAYLRGELDGVEDQLKRAFSDTEAQLKQQQAALRERMRGC